MPENDEKEQDPNAEPLEDMTPDGDVTGGGGVRPDAQKKEDG